MYADDSTLYASANTLGELGKVLNEELKLVEEWITVNKLVVNIEKTKCMVFSLERSLKDAPILHLTIRDTDIEKVTEAKLLGITVDSQMSWNSQIDQMVVKMVIIQ